MISPAQILPLLSIFLSLFNLPRRRRRRRRKQEPQMDHQKYTSLLVWNFDREVTKDEIFQLFQEASPNDSLVSVEMIEDERRARLNFANPKDAETLNVVLYGFPLNYRPIEICMDPSPQKMFTGEYHDVYVGNLSDSTTEEQLKTVFSSFGYVAEVSVFKTRGIGFVKFQDADSAVNAISSLNGRSFAGKIWHVNKGHKKSKRQEEIKEGLERGLILYVGNLDERRNENHVQALFAPYGNVTSCKIRRDSAGRSKGDGFVEYSEPQEARRALELNHHILDGKQMRVRFANFS